MVKTRSHNRIASGPARTSLVLHFVATDAAMAQRTLSRRIMLRR
jgi:hypothetical protein